MVHWGRLIEVAMGKKQQSQWTLSVQNVSMVHKEFPDFECATSCHYCSGNNIVRRICTAKSVLLL
jgi:hypothetical protein